jgi:hypothetical protein
LYDPLLKNRLELGHTFSQVLEINQQQQAANQSREDQEGYKTVECE